MQGFQKHMAYTLVYSRIAVAVILDAFPVRDLGLPQIRIFDRTPRVPLRIGGFCAVLL